MKSKCNYIQATTDERHPSPQQKRGYEKQIQEQPQHWYERSFCDSIFRIVFIQFSGYYRTELESVKYFIFVIEL